MKLQPVLTKPPLGLLIVVPLCSLLHNYLWCGACAIRVLELFPPPAHRLEPMNRNRSCNSLVINTGSTSEETEQGAAVGAEFAMMAIPTSRERAGRPSKEEFPVSLSDAAASLEVAGRHAEPHAIRIARLLYEEEILPTDLEGLEEHTANLLGSGGFGSVRKLFWRGTPVAAKVSHGDISETQKQLFLRELELMVRCRHPNIVQFLGFVDTPFMIVMEFLPMGDLKMEHFDCQKEMGTEITFSSESSHQRS